MKSPWWTVILFVIFAAIAYAWYQAPYVPAEAFGPWREAWDRQQALEEEVRKSREEKLESEGRTRCAALPTSERLSDAYCRYLDRKK